MRQLRTIDQAHVAGKRIFVRVDFNVPFAGGKVADDRKIRQSLPTLKRFITGRAAHLTLATHFSKEGAHIKPIRDRLESLIPHSSFQILENLRLNPGEEHNDPAFARQLAGGHDLYVNDAFAVCHREHASVVGITKFLPAYAGLLVSHEVAMLGPLLNNPKRPFVVLIGGAKVQDKVAVIERLADRADTILVGGRTGIEYRNTKLHFPKVLPLIDDVDGFDIGPETIALFKRELANAQTVFWNGNLGKSEDPNYAKGTVEIARFLAQLKAKVYVGGGDTSKIVDDLKLSDKMTFVSTGGGATLEFLASNGELPGLLPLYQS